MKIVWLVACVADEIFLPLALFLLVEIPERRGKQAKSITSGHDLEVEPAVIAECGWSG